MRDDPEGMAGWPDPHADTKLARIPSFEEWIAEADRDELRETIRRAIKKWLTGQPASFMRMSSEQIQVSAKEMTDAIMTAILEPPNLLPQSYVGPT